MVRLSYTGVAFILCLAILERRSVEGCHAGHTQTEETHDEEDVEEGLIPIGFNGTLNRAKRQIKQHGDGFDVLRAYFRSCMLDKVPEEWDWKSVIDFSVLKTLWFLYSGTVACTEAKKKDDSECWRDCIDVYLRSTSSLIGPAKECVNQYEADSRVGKYVYTARVRKTEKLEPGPTGKYRECVQAQYNEADPESLFHDTGIHSVPVDSELNVNTIVRFVRGHVRCVICDYSALPSGRSIPDFKENIEISETKQLVDGSVVYTVTWPFSFEALVRRDARLRAAIHFCNKELEVTFRKDPPPNPGWTQWFTWGSCNAVCGVSGVQKRLRVCLDETGRNCPGNKFDDRVCFNRNCAYWANWGPYTPCISTCDLSEQFSFRYCINGEVGDEGCRGERRRSKSCAIASCEIPWSQWSDCTVTCGGGGLQHRTGGDSLLKMRTETRSCAPGQCPDQWSPWSPWGPCSKTCGNGRRVRMRNCLSQPACTGSSKEYTSCRGPPCKAHWGRWAPWSECVYRKRSRACVGGNTCEGKNEIYQRCAHSDCTAPQRKKWSDWTQWTVCNTSCGSGKQWRFRKCLEATPPFSNECSGGASESQSCNNGPCHYSSGRSNCQNHYNWDLYCRTRYVNCNSDSSRKLCRKSCGYC